MKRMHISEVLVKEKNVIQKADQRDERRYDLPGPGSSVDCPIYDPTLTTQKAGPDHVYTSTEGYVENLGSI